VWSGPHERSVHVEGLPEVHGSWVASALPPALAMGACAQ
jgi:hypothetical protein